MLLLIASISAVEPVVMACSRGWFKFPPGDRARTNTCMHVHGHMAPFAPVTFARTRAETTWTQEVQTYVLQFKCRFCCLNLVDQRAEHSARAEKSRVALSWCPALQLMAELPKETDRGDCALD